MCPPVDEPTGTFIVPDRDELRAQFKRNVLVRANDAKTTLGTLVHIEAAVMADTLLPLYADAAKAGNGVALENRTRLQLEQELIDMGLEAPLEAVGASGFVKISASVGGGNITAGDVLVNDETRIRYRATTSAHYDDGDPCGVEGIDTGTETNLDPEVKLRWESPPAGINDTAEVIEQADGTGLAGGRPAETNGQIVERVRFARANPPASGNDAQIQLEVFKTDNVPIEAVFTHPCIKGEGTTGIVFLLRPEKPGGNRIPNGAQITAVQNQLIGAFPKDFGNLVGSVIADNKNIAIRVKWSKAVDDWADLSPWPPYQASNRVSVMAAPAPTTSSCRLTDGVPHAATPTVGITIAFFDRDKLEFRKKRVASVTVVGTDWDVTFDMTNDASDREYVPKSGDWVCPWSDSLNLLVPVLLGYFDTLGPGEQSSNLYDEGYRVKRNPPVTEQWLSSLDERVTQPFFDSGALERLTFSEPTFPVTPAVGSPGVSSNLLRVGNFGVFSV
jgi:uncharacterized phage protein gp47/JayE